MNPSRRFLLVGSAALLTAGCATRPSSPTEQGSAGHFSLIEAFRGRTIGTGVFRVPITGLERRFKAYLTGTVRGKTLTIVEDFVFEDGETDRLTWRFTRTGSNTWAGRREDTVGLAQVTETGSEIRLEYTADAKSGGGTTRLGFADVIYRRADGVVVNEAVITRLGVPVGSVTFELRRR